MNEAETFFAPIVAMQNTGNLVSHNADFTEMAWTVKQAQSASGIAARDDLRWLAAWIREHVASVREEIQQFRAHRHQDSVTLARRCFLFSIVSPQCNFEENVIATRQLMDNWDQLTSIEAIKQCLIVPYKGTGKLRIVNLGPTKAQRILEAMPWLRSLTPDNLETAFSYESIRAQKGIADKAASMTRALFDDASEVFTLDTWMLRITLALNGQDIRATIATKAAGYKITASDWLAWIKRHLPDLTPFEVQWTLWNGCFGQHKNHLGILA
jgi:hypothetical protein